MPEPVPPTTLAVVGLGAVGGLLAGILQRAGHEVLALTSPRHRRQLAADGYAVRSPRFGDFRAHPLVLERLDRPCAGVFICVKAYQLDEALSAIDRDGVGEATVVPLLNGLEHMAVVRDSFQPSHVLAGSIGRIETKREAFDVVVHSNAESWIGLAGYDPSTATASRIDATAELLRSAGIEVDVMASESTLLWKKLVRLAPLACVTAASGLTLGEARHTEPWRSLLSEAVAETVAVANAHDVLLSVDETLDVIDGLPGHISTSMARDIAAGRPSELGTIAGAVQRAASAVGLACPALNAMIAKVAVIQGVS